MSTIEILLPQFGMGMQSGEIVNWSVGVGDKVTAGQTIVEVEAEKATVEVPSPSGGTIVELLVQEGDTVAVRTPIAKLAVS